MTFRRFSLHLPIAKHTCKVSLLTIFMSFVRFLMWSSSVKQHLFSLQILWLSKQKNYLLLLQKISFKNRENLLNRFIFSLQILYIFYNTIFIPAVIQGWARPRWVVTPAPGLHGGRGDWVRIEPRTGINSHRVRIEPGTGHQQSSVLQSYCIIHRFTYLNNCVFLTELDDLEPLEQIR